MNDEEFKKRVIGADSVFAEKQNQYHHQLLNLIFKLQDEVRLIKIVIICFAAVKGIEIILGWFK